MSDIEVKVDKGHIVVRIPIDWEKLKHETLITAAYRALSAELPAMQAPPPGLPVWTEEDSARVRELAARTGYLDASAHQQAGWPEHDPGDGFVHDASACARCRLEAAHAPKQQGEI